MKDYFAIIDATWPAAAYHRVGPWMLREGQGAGSRVSSITAIADWTEGDIDTAATASRDIGQRPLFMIRPQDTELDATLEARGYEIRDRVVIYAMDVAPLTIEIMPYARAFTIWPPLAIMDDIWEVGGIGAERRGVMARAAAPKAGVLGRAQDRAAGVAYVGLHDGSAMLHSVEVLPDLRRNRVSSNMLRAAAHWAKSLGGTEVSLVTTRENLPANAAYTSMGMQVVGHYHYRIHPEA